MSFFKTLIVGVDFSEYSKLVVRQALRFNQHHGSKIVLVHATTGTTQFLGNLAIQELTVKYSDTLREAMPAHYKLSNRHDVEYCVHYGYPEEILVKEAQKHEDPLIMVGHRGHGPIGRFFLGSTAERLALHSPFPVWIQRGNSVVETGKILVPHDLTEHSDAAVRQAEDRLAKKKKDVEIFYVQKPHAPVLDIHEWKKLDRQIKSEAASAVKKVRTENKGLKFFQSYGDPAAEVIKKAKKFDVVALTPRTQHRAFATLGSVTAKLVRALNEPVIVFPVHSSTTTTGSASL